MLFRSTEFVQAQTDGLASFLLVQDHRWDVKLPEKTTGDSQVAGVRVASKETATPPKLQIFASGTGPTTTTSTTSPTTTTSSTTSTTTPAGSTITAEFENLTVVSSSGDSIGLKSDTQASGGKSVLFRSNAVGDYVVFAVNVPTAGTYSVTMTAKMQGDRGTVQFAVADTAAGPYTSIDPPKDEYRSTLTFGSVGVFTQKVTFASAGTKYVRLNVTGKNAASSGYYLSADKLTLTP